jgi:hypothetical protein
MAFNFGGGNQNVFGTPGATLGGTSQVQTGPDLEEITTEVRPVVSHLLLSYHIMLGY